MVKIHLAYILRGDDENADGNENGGDADEGDEDDEDAIPNHDV